MPPSGNGATGSVEDLGTLGGPNSNVTCAVKNDSGIMVGISQTATPEPLGESWSSFAFYPGPNNVGYVNLGFVWQIGKCEPADLGWKQRLRHRGEQPR